MRSIRSYFVSFSVLLTAGAMRQVAAQTVDTARVREAYNAATAMRTELERAHGRFATVNGIRLHYAEWGDAKGVPLVWVHGSGSFAYELRKVAPQLVQAGYRVLSVDSRGHGMTQVTDYDFGMSHIADDLIALLDHLKIPKAVFGGASMGAFVAAAVYDHYPTRVLGLLMSDGGTWSPQWIFDRQTPEQIRRNLPDPIPQITGASEFDVFQKIVGGNIPAGNLNLEWLFDMLMRIGPSPDGGWAFLPGFDRRNGTYELWSTSIARPTTLPLSQWSLHAMIPRTVFRNLHVPMMILDPQNDRDVFPVTDQNERLAQDHPDLVIHRVYAQSGHNILQSRPDWLVRDAAALLDRVRKQAR